MVRTKADNSARKAVAAKAPRKVLGSSSGGGSSSSAGCSSASGKDKYGGGNPVCLRPTPDWQKKIDFFVMKSPSRGEENEDNMELEKNDETGQSASSQGSNSSGTQSNSSSPSPKKRKPVIESDDEDD